MRTHRVLVLSFAVTAVLCATPLAARAQQSVADGFPPHILSPALPLPGTAVHVQAVLVTGGGQTQNSNALVMIAE